MSQKIVGITFLVFLATLPGLAADRDISTKDLQGVPHKHRYIWAVAGATALGAGIGIIAPGGTKSAFKGALIGGSTGSFLYLASHRNTPGAWRPWAMVATNAGLIGGIGWTLCDCRAGFGAGAFIGGGGTAAIQALGTRNPTLARVTGANDKTPKVDNNGQVLQSPPSNLPDNPQPQLENQPDMNDPQ